MTPSNQPVIVDLEHVFVGINKERLAAGLPQIEHAVMRVRVNIRLAIKGHNRIEGVLPVVLAETAADELCHVLNELFQTSLNLTQLLELSKANDTPIAEQTAAPADPAGHQASPIKDAQPAPTITNKPMADQTSSDPSAKRIYLIDLYVAINQSRRHAQLPPIEPAVIAVRLGVRFSILRRRRLDFGQAYLEMAPLDLDALQTILAEQFDVQLAGGVHELVVAGLRRVAEQPRKLSWLERVFRRRAHHISVPTMIMAVMRQRANLGYKPVSPTQIADGCQQKMAGIGINLTPTMTDLKLSDAQLDQLSEYLRNEYGLYFEDLEAFLDPDKK